MTATDKLNEYKARLESELVDGDRPIAQLAEKLADVATALSGGGGGSSITQAEVTAAIQGSTNIDGIETLIARSWINADRKLLTSSSPEFGNVDGIRFWTVPSGERWQVCTINAVVVTSATVGDRLFSARAGSAGTENYLRAPVGVTQAASLTRNYTWGVGMPDQTAFRGATNGTVATSIPPVILYPSDVLLILDANSISLADTVTPNAVVFRTVI